jgi:molybdate transport system permease protein
MIPGSQNLDALLLTIQLALVTTLILAIIGTPLAWWLATTRSRVRMVAEPIVALPLILPPTVLGFYLLVAFAPDALLGSAWLQMTGSTLAFSFSGLVAGSIIYSLPFYVQPLQVAFEGMEDGILDAASTLGAGPIDRFFTVTLPLCRRGFITAASLAFAHTIGEFGIVLMIGGNIPGETRVLSIAIYDHVEALQYAEAHALSAGLLVFSFVLLFCVYSLNKKT